MGIALKSYYKGTHVFVTLTFSSPHDPMNREYAAEVARAEELLNGEFGGRADAHELQRQFSSRIDREVVILPLTRGEYSFIFVLGNERHTHSSGASPPSSSRPHAAPPEVCIAIR